MAGAPQPQPYQGGAPPQGPAPGGPGPGPQGGAPSQAPASPEQMMLARLFQAVRLLSQQNPVMSAGLEKAAQGIQEAQSALMTQPQPQPAQQTPPQ